MRSFSCQKCPKKELRFGQIQSACLKVSYGNGNPSAVRFSEAIKSDLFRVREHRSVFDFWQQRNVFRQKIDKLQFAVFTPAK